MIEPGMNAPTESTKQATVPWRQLAADSVLWALLMGLLTGFRALLIAIFRDKLAPGVGFDPFLRCFTAGLRFDVSIVTYAMLPTLTLTLVGFIRPLGRWHGRMRGLVTGAALTVFIVACVADVGYFAEYDDQFNHWIFGLLHDDRRAIWLTIWRTYPVVTLLICSGAGITAAAWGVNKLWRAGATCRLVPESAGPLWIRLAAILFIITATALCLRGSLGRRPVQLKDSAITGDDFLNKSVLNPISAVRYAISEHRSMQSVKGLNTLLPGNDVRAAAASLFPDRVNAANLDTYLERIAPGAAGKKPGHVFIVMMESYDAWAMATNYSWLHLTDRLAALGREGILVRPFLPAGDMTIKSLGAVITGLPFAGVLVNYQPEVRKGVPTAAAAIFKRLGYKPRFFYSGYLRWQRIGDFAREQGFEEVWGGDQMGTRLTGNEWGVDDDTLFRFVLDRTGEEPTFNLLMSASYHPPFSVDLAAAGFDAGALGTNELGRDLPPDKLRVLGHLWYSDKCLGDFVAGAERKLSRPLFALTGDHYSRECFAPRPTLSERTAVPLVLCGRDALDQVARPTAVAGAHMDILPTLINLVAPGGFQYHAFGHDLLDPSRPQHGFGCEAVVGQDFIMTQRTPRRLENLEGGTGPDGVPMEELSLRYRRLHALSWWRAMKGKEWPASTSKPQ